MRTTLKNEKDIVTVLETWDRRKIWVRRLHDIHIVRAPYICGGRTKLIPCAHEVDTVHARYIYAARREWIFLCRALHFRA